MPTARATPLAAPQPFVTPGSTGATISPGGPSKADCAGGDALGADKAAAKARDLLDHLGADLRDARTSVSTDGAMSNVEVDQRIGGRDTGVSWSVAFVGSRLQSLWGPLAHLVDLGTYPLISPAQAVDRLSDPRFGTSVSLPVPMAATASSGLAPAKAPDSCVSPVPAAGQSSGGAPVAAQDGVVTGPCVAPTGRATPGPAESAAPVAPPVPTPGARLAWEVKKVTLVKADLVVVPTSLTNGSTVLLPTYRFTDTEGSTWDTPAVADTSLAF